MNIQTIAFSNENKPEFIRELRNRVKSYFEQEHKSKFGNFSMVFKSVFMVMLYLIPYFLMITGIVTHIWPIMLMWIIMGIGMAGVGLSIMHDANHGSYSKNPQVNKILGYLLNFIGGNKANWKIQHNFLHHSFTNIDGFDEDIDAGIILRFSPHAKRYRIHRFQFLYAWILYGIMTLSWVVAKDFHQLFRYRKSGLWKNQNKSFAYLFLELNISKVIYFLYAFVIPMIVLPVPWWTIIIGFVAMHFVTGFIFGIVFQTAHVTPNSDYPLPDNEGNIENNWAIHQLYTTSDYSPKSRVLSWFIGGLNYQIEHHLFPNICHVHYKKLSEIVKRTTSEYNLPYNVNSNFLLAIYNHAKMLWLLGKYDTIYST
jgi:linoleoyl-CoA desaturase